MVGPGISLSGRRGLLANATPRPWHTDTATGRTIRGARGLIVFGCADAALIVAAVTAFAQPLVGLVPISADEANADVEGEPVAVATSDGIVGDTSAGYARSECVELSRLCVRPGENWATRVMLRLWREQQGPKWPCVKPRAGMAPLAAVAYSKNERHDGRIYRFDGWTKVTDRAGSSGGGQWTPKRTKGDTASGTKTLWLWRYPALARLDGEPR